MSAFSRLLVLAVMVLPSVDAARKCSRTTFPNSINECPQADAGALCTVSCDRKDTTLNAICDPVTFNWVIPAGDSCPACPTTPYPGCCADEKYNSYGDCKDSACQVFGADNSARANCNPQKCPISTCAYVHCESTFNQCWGLVECSNTSSPECYAPGMPCLQDGTSPNNFKICVPANENPCADVECPGNVTAIEGDDNGQGQGQGNVQKKCTCPEPPPTNVCDLNPGKCGNCGECYDDNGVAKCKCSEGTVGESCDVCAVGFSFDVEKKICCPVGCTCDTCGKCNGCQEEFCAHTSGVCIYPGGPHPFNGKHHGKPTHWPGARCVCPKGRKCCADKYVFVKGDPGSPAYCCHEGCNCDGAGKCLECRGDYCKEGYTCHLGEDGLPTCDGIPS